MSGAAFHRQQLEDSYLLLFDRGRPPRLESLTVGSLKKAYRKKIFQSHPDRAIVLGIDASVLAEKSKEITGSYELLLEYLETGRGRPAARYAAAKTARAEARRQGRAARKPIDEAFFFSIRKFQVPPGRVRLAQYLYYLGIIDFITVVNAITWQKTSRPYLGLLARELNMLTDEDTARIVRERRKGELFGACAIRLGRLTPDRLALLLEEQDARTPKIGTYFLTHAILDGRELELVLRKLDEHNLQASVRKSA